MLHWHCVFLTESFNFHATMISDFLELIRYDTSFLILKLIDFDCYIFPVDEDNIVVM